MRLSWLLSAPKRNVISFLKVGYLKIEVWELRVLTDWWKLYITQTWWLVVLDLLQKSLQLWRDTVYNGIFSEYSSGKIPPNPRKSPDGWDMVKDMLNNFLFSIGNLFTAAKSKSFAQSASRHSLCLPMYIFPLWHATVTAFSHLMISWCSWNG